MSDNSVSQSAYQQFLQQKRVTVAPSGFDVTTSDVSARLHAFQNACVRRSLQAGKYALFQECGLGKSLQEMEWARFVADYTGKPVLILTPLAVAWQMLAEAAKFGYDLRYAESQAVVVGASVYVTNYERLHLFEASTFGGVVLDESSILKAFMGTTKRAILKAFAATPFKLCASATPAPNDVLELGNHAEFLDVMPSNEMLARWFINDSSQAGVYRLKKHAVRDFWRWVTSWAVFLSNPRDLGPDYAIEGYDLPALNIHERFVSTNSLTIERTHAEGKLLPDGNPSSTKLGKVKRESLEERLKEVVRVVESVWGLSLTGNRTKLAELWHGNQNTPNGAKKSTILTPKSGPDGGLKEEHPKRTESTCEPTTKKTKSSSKNTNSSTLTSETLDGVNAMPAILNIEKRQKRRQKSATSKHDSTTDCAVNSELAQTNTTQSLPSKMDAAQSAALNLQTQEDIDSTLTTATKQGSSEGFFAHHATWGLENSETILSFSGELRNTSLKPQKLEPIIIWCELDAEQRALEAIFGDFAISVYGSLSGTEKEARISAFIQGARPILISKASIVGYGLNLQHVGTHIDMSPTFSFEQWYQKIRRSWRYGRTEPVDVYLIATDTLDSVLATIRRKEAQFRAMQADANDALREYGLFRDDSARGLASSAGTLPMILPDWLTSKGAA